MTAETTTRAIADLDSVKAAIVRLSPILPDDGSLNISLNGPGDLPELDVHGAQLQGIGALRRVRDAEVEVHDDDLGYPKWAEVELDGVSVTFYR